MKQYLIFNWSKSTLNTFSDRNEQYNNWGYQDNPKPIYIFLQKNFERTKKHQNAKQTISILLEIFVHAKNCCPCCFLFASFCFIS